MQLGHRSSQKRSKTSLSLGLYSENALRLRLQQLHLDLHRRAKDSQDGDPLQKLPNYNISLDQIDASHTGI